MKSEQTTNQNMYIVAVDIIGSTQREHEIGTGNYALERKHFLGVVGQIAKHYGAEEPKNITDGFCLHFQDIQNFLLFIAAVDFLNTVEQSSFFPLKVRLAGTFGIITTVNDQENGLPINLAARLESYAEKPLLTQEIMDGLIKVEGNEASCFFDKVDEPIDLKGFSQTPGCYWFDTKGYANQHPKKTFHYLAYQYLKGAGVIFSDLQPADLLNPGKLVFPIVPRPKINLIHAGLIQIARIFSILNWEIEILVADIALEDRVDCFKEKIQKALDTEKIKTTSIMRLTELVKGSPNDCCCSGTPRPTNSCCEITHGHLFNYMEKASIDEVKNVLKKKGEDSPHDKKYLASLRPLFTWATVQHLYKDSDRKVAVLAGADERKLWEGLSETPASVHIPIIDKKKGKKQFIQTRPKDSLTWLSEESLIEAMVGTNIQGWASKIIHRLDIFPERAITLPQTIKSNKKEKIAALIFEKLNEYNSSL